MSGHRAGGGYELRVTRRCLIEDLDFRDEDANTTVSDLAARNTRGADLLRTFVDKRALTPEPTDEDVLNGLTPDTPAMYPLRRGDQQRGLTWYDDRNGLVWLVAAHHAHKSGAATDSYRYFRGLSRADLLPSREDMTKMRSERASEAVDRIFDDVPRLRKVAATRRNVEVRGHVGRVPIGMVMTTDDPPHLYLAVSRTWETAGTNPPEAWVFALIARCFGHLYDDMSYLPLDSRMPNRDSDPDEDIYSDFVSE